MILDYVREALYNAITTPRLDAIPPVRLQKNLARRFNTLIGSPLCTRDEMKRRREAQRKLAALKRSQETTTVARAKAPVLVYFEKDRNSHELRRVRELLDAKAIAYTALDVTGDEVTLDFVARTAKCKPDDLPVVFVADQPIGNYSELVRADVSGSLARAIDGG